MWSRKVPWKFWQQVATLLSAARRQRRSLYRPQPAGAVEPLEQRTLLSVLVPSQVRHAYGVDQINFGSVAGNGAGQTIAIIDPGDDPKLVDSTDPSFSSSDLAKFDTDVRPSRPAQL